MTTIDHDLPCPTCSYNLRTRKPGDNCPECGSSIPPLPVTLSGFIDCPKGQQRNLARSPLCVFCRAALPAYVLPPEKLAALELQPRHHPLVLPLVHALLSAMLLVFSFLYSDSSGSYARLILFLYLLICLLILAYRYRRQRIGKSP